MIKKKEVEIDPEYKNRIYGYKLCDYNSLIELSILYEQVLQLKSKRARQELILAIRNRAITIGKKHNKKLILSLFENN